LPKYITPSLSMVTHMFTMSPGVSAASKQVTNGVPDRLICELAATENNKMDKTNRSPFFIP
jgi:hypothetical protein